MHVGLLAKHESGHMSFNDMLSFVPDGRECFPNGDERGIILDIGVVEPERTARRRPVALNLIVASNLIAVNFPAANFAVMNGSIATIGCFGGLAT